VRVALLLAVTLACAGPSAGRRVVGGADGDARDTLSRFARSLVDRRFGDAQALLSARWRGVYSPARLAEDLDGAGALGREQAERVLALLETGAVLEADGDRRVLPVGPGRAALLVREGNGWRVDALE